VSSSIAVPTEKTVFGHPPGLFLLFFTEMWERFSYYGMRALLVLYMVDYLIKGIRTGSIHVLGFGLLENAIQSIAGPQAIQPLASYIYGLYTALVYLTPVFGGMLADRLLGQRKTVVVGGVLMAIGHFLMAVESLFLVALVFLIIGNGCFKPNISTQVGSLYPEGDPRLDRAYTIFYAGVNLGAFFSPLVCGTLGQVYGWHYGFGAAGVGMVLGVILYLWGQRFLAPDRLTTVKETKVEAEPITSYQWKGIIGLIVLTVLNIVFWAVYEQQGNTVQLFADRNTDWHFYKWQLPSTWFQAFNPMFIFVLTPLLNMLWGWQSRARKEPPSVTKMAMGCVLLGVSFLPLMYITRGLGGQERINFLWLVGCTLIYTLGEMYLSPIGLSLVVKVAPAQVVSMMMGIWYMANFFGNLLSGYIGAFYEKMSRESFFLLLAALGIASGIAIFASSKPLKDAVGHDS
jgi:POT family proton-dependent oligopeptide transporter